MVASTMSSTRKLSGFFSPGNRICTVCAAVKRNGLAACGAALIGLTRLVSFFVLALLGFACLTLVFALARAGLVFLAFAALMAESFRRRPAITIIRPQAGTEPMDASMTRRSAHFQDCKSRR